MLGGQTKPIKAFLVSSDHPTLPTISTKLILSLNKQTAEGKGNKKSFVYIPLLREFNIHICISARNTNIALINCNWKELLLACCLDPKTVHKSHKSDIHV